MSRLSKILEIFEEALDKLGEMNNWRQVNGPRAAGRSNTDLEIKMRKDTDVSDKDCPETSSIL